ncbi:hypothetical protein L3476_23650 [Paenibacillus thiaminolyticus]|uniref:hypothetical protein n=1 Tax=Paenibacillus thiaminolyticus TaxID=49283 RepID=UPI00234FFFD9|nr:hypothetical protein [Paenibacillus thiaminolyticus]WCR26237.1 hypothetical protein L3476_23650 [Paenibacillus thiaminolyticus]
MLEEKRRNNKTLLLGEFAKAKKLIDAYEVSLPEDLETYSLKANYCFLIGKYEEAEQIMKKAILNFDLQYNMAMVYQAQQKRVGIRPALLIK